MVMVTIHIPSATPITTILTMAIMAVFITLIITHIIMMGIIKTPFQEASRVAVIFHLTETGIIIMQTQL